MARRFGPTIVIIVVFILAVAVQAQAERRVALVIGNASYQNAPRLANPGNDAVAVAGLLRNAGFDRVELRRDLGDVELRSIIKDFTDATRDADVAVVFYAGHGIEVDGTNYLVPVDAKLARTSTWKTRRFRSIVCCACWNRPNACGSSYSTPAGTIRFQRL